MAMSAQHPSPQAGSAPARRYLRAPVPVRFPVTEEMPEKGPHMELRTTLYLAVEHAFALGAQIGSDQFVYWDPTNPRECCAPDLFVRKGRVNEEFGCWKVWERGAPELAVEIVSRSDEGDRPWQDKLARYRRLGVLELVRFDPDDAQQPLRIWDQIDGDLVERDSEDPDFRRCDTLEAFWCVRDRDGLELRLSRDREGTDLFLTPAEDERRQKDDERRQKEEERRGRLAAEQRVRELEAELARRGP